LEYGVTILVLIPAAFVSLRYALRGGGWGRTACESCGYSLRGLRGRRCPECGHENPRAGKGGRKALRLTWWESATWRSAAAGGGLLALLYLTVAAWSVLSEPPLRLPTKYWKIASQAEIVRYEGRRVEIKAESEVHAWLPATTGYGYVLPEPVRLRLVDAATEGTAIDWRFRRLSVDDPWGLEAEAGRPAQRVDEVLIRTLARQSGLCEDKASVEDLAVAIEALLEQRWMDHELFEYGHDREEAATIEGGIAWYPLWRGSSGGKELTKPVGRIGLGVLGLVGVVLLVRIWREELRRRQS